MIHLGEQKETPVKVSLLAFAGDGCEEQVATNPDEFSLLENDAMVGVLR